MAYYRSQSQQRGHQQMADQRIRELVLQKVAISLLLAAFISGIIAIYFPFNPLLYFLAIGVEIIAIIGYYFSKKESTIETLYYMFVGSSSVLLGYTFQFYLATLTNGLEIITYAVGITGTIVGGIYYYTATRNPDVSYMTKYLFPLGLIFIIVYIAGIFLIGGELFYLIISFFGALLFSAYLYYDLGRLMDSDQVYSPARMSWQIYWDILLIFKFILRILYSLLGDR